MRATLYYGPNLAEGPQTNWELKRAAALKGAFGGASPRMFCMPARGKYADGHEAITEGQGRIEDRH